MKSVKITRKLKELMSMYLAKQNPDIDAIGKATGLTRAQIVYVAKTLGYKI